MESDAGGVWEVVMKKALSIALIGLVVLATVGPVQAEEDNAFKKAGHAVVTVVVWPFKMLGNGLKALGNGTKKLFGKGS
jgi:hypothetical protein